MLSGGYFQPVLTSVGKTLYIYNIIIYANKVPQRLELVWYWLNPNHKGTLKEPHNDIRETLMVYIYIYIHVHVHVHVHMTIINNYYICTSKSDVYSSVSSFL